MPDTAPIPDIRDIPPPPQLDEPPGLWLYLVVAAVVLATPIVVALLRRRWPGRAEGGPQGSPRDRALDTLHELKTEYAQIPPDEFATRTVGALRLVLVDRFGERSKSQTPDEFFAALEADRDLDRQLPPTQRQHLAELLGGCDRLRFAPGPDANSKRLPLAEAAIGFVRELPPPATDADPATA